MFHVSGQYRILALALPLAALAADRPCQVTRPTADFSIPHVSGSPKLSADPAAWKSAASAWIEKDCSSTMEYPKLKTEIRAFWNDTDLYLLFICPYQSLNVFRPAHNETERDKLWDRDVVEIFLGGDWINIRHYREFEIAPTGDWVDLAIDLDRKGEGERWQSGWSRLARIEKDHWYAAARIPLESISADPVRLGTRWRMNLYRIDGAGPDPVRHFLCWQPTCVVNRDPNHVPENFGTLIFGQ